MSKYLSPEWFDELEEHCRGAISRNVFERWEADKYFTEHVDCVVMLDIIELVKALRNNQVAEREHE